MKETKSSVIVNSVDRAIDILEYLFAQGTETSVTQIGKDLGMHKSTVYRSLVTLQNRGYVMQNPKSGNYYLGIKVYILASQSRMEWEISGFLKPYLKELSLKFNEAVNASVLERNHEGMYKSVIIAKESSYQSLVVNTTVGSFNECYCAAVGKCLLAFAEDVDLSVYKKYPMKQFTEYTITTVEGLQQELEKVRRNRYAVDNEEREKGLFCIGTPILKDGVAIAAISLSGPTARVRDDRLEEKIEYLKALGEEISQKFSMR